MHRSAGNWDDLRFVLAVADIGSVSGAARALGVNHATVLRRIAAFEEAEGARVFDRTPSGYVVPPSRRAVIDAAREAAVALAAVSRSLRAADAGQDPVVRVTSTDSFCQHVLPPILADMTAQPGLPAIELISTNAHLDLARPVADLTVRPSLRLPEGLAGEAAAELGFAAYAAAGGPDRWLGLSGVLQATAPARWIDEVTEGASLPLRADSFLSVAALAARGLGRAYLPAILGDAAPELVRLADLPRFAVKIWVACHPDLAASAPVARVAAAIRAGLAARAAWLRG